MDNVNKVSEALHARLENAREYDTLAVNIFLRGEPAVDALNAMVAATDDGVGEIAIDTDTRRVAIDNIKQQAASEQQPLLDFLGGTASDALMIDGVAAVQPAAVMDTSWATNSVTAEVTPSVLEQILAREDVLLVELVHHVDLSELMDAQMDAAETPLDPPLDPNAVVDAVAEMPPPVTVVAPTWSVKRLNAPLLWQLGIRGAGVLVAVIDTGVNYTHPDLRDQMWYGGATYPHHGYDFASNDDDPFDEAGHGTSCAGIVAGNGAAGQGTGVAPEATVMALRVGGTENNYWKAFEFAIDQGVQVISMSMSWKYPMNPNYVGWRRACEALAAAGILHANSIGNQGSQLTSHPIPFNIATPGNCPPPWLHPQQSLVGGVSSVISCGATDDNDRLAGYSGRGPASWNIGPYVDYPYQIGGPIGLIKPDICAPGPGTSSCNWQYGQFPSASPYSPFGGTSAATPHVAGCLALLADACVRANQPIMPSRIQEALENTAVRIGGQTRDKENHYGAGRVDVYAAYKYGENLGWW